jgi:hypothetical protein
VRDADQAQDGPDVDDDRRRLSMTSLGTLLAQAHGGGEKTLWDPTILGVLTVLAAVVLFCGSVYLLLSTNMGARLGFLVASAALTGFMVLLTTLWWTSGNSGIDPPHGDSPSWKVLEVVSDPSESKNAPEIAQQGEPLAEQQLTNLRPAMDEALVPAETVAGEEAPDQPLAISGLTATGYLINFEGYRAFEQGGGTKNLFWHEPKLAAIELCPTKKDSSGQNEIPLRCDPLADTQFAILQLDLGSLRQPVVAYWFASVILFALSLLGLHWWEQDERARRRAALAPVPAPGA